MAKIYQVAPPQQDLLLGRIESSEGRIYEMTSGKDLFVGQVDYENGEVYDEEDYFLGWVEEDGEIFASYAPEDDDDADESEYIGHVDKAGKLYLFTDKGELQVGLITDMTNVVEAAAALLIFLSQEA